MHGCTQTAADATRYGFDSLADANGFVVGYPEQQTANNPLRCFNWAEEYGNPANVTRGHGENLSIKQMDDKLVADHKLDPKRVFVAGFSAGAAEADRLLASTLEPCVMCAGASMEIGIDTVVYGLRANEDGGVQRVRPPRSPENQTPRFVGPRHEARARALFETFLTQSGDHPSAPFVRSLLEASRGGPRA